MLETLATVLIALWFLGLANSQEMGGLLHALPVIALVVILLRFRQRRRV